MLVKVKQIFFNVDKTELVIFTSLKRRLDSDLKIKLNGIFKLYETGSFKYLRMQIDKNLTWKQQVNHVAIKLYKTNAMLSKLRYMLCKNLWSQSAMQYLNPICVMLHFSEIKTLMLSKCFTYYRRNPWR